MSLWEMWQNFHVTSCGIMYLQFDEMIYPTISLKNESQILEAFLNLHHERKLVNCQRVFQQKVLSVLLVNLIQILVFTSSMDYDQWYLLFITILHAV